MRKEEAEKYIKENNSKIIGYAIMMGYYAEEEYERLAEIAQSIKIIFDSSNSDIYGVYSSSNFSITLNNEQFKNELDLLIYYSHELFHAFDDKKKTTGFQQNEGKSFINKGTGINEGVTQRKAENVAKRILGIKPKQSEEESIGVKLVTDLDEYEIEDKMSRLLAKAMGISYEEFIKMSSLDKAAKKCGDIAGSTSLFNDIVNLIDKIYGYRQSTWFDKDSYMRAITNFYESQGYQKMEMDEELGLDESQGLMFFHNSGVLVTEDSYVDNLKENIIAVEEAILKLYLKREFLELPISSFEQFVELANEFVTDFIIPINVDYKEMYDSIIAENEHELYHLQEGEQNSEARVFNIYQYQHDLVLSKIKGIEALKDYKIININLESVELDEVISHHNYNEENLIRLIEQDSDALLRDGNSLELYVKEEDDYYMLIITLKHDGKGNLDCDIISKKKVDANDVIDATLNNMCNGNQEEFISVFRDVDRPCEEKRAITRKERYDKRLFEYENLYEALDERDESKKVEEVMSSEDELSMLAAGMGSPFGDSDPFTGFKM